MTPENFSLFCKGLVISSGKTQTDLADEIGFKQSQLNRAINKPDSRDDQLRIALCQHFGYSVNFEITVKKRGAK